MRSLVAESIFGMTAWCAGYYCSLAALRLERRRHRGLHPILVCRVVLPAIFQHVLLARGGLDPSDPRCPYGSVQSGCQPARDTFPRGLLSVVGMVSDSW